MTAPAERRWQGTARSGGLRVDKYLADVERVLSRSQLKARSARVFVNTRPQRLSYKLKAGDSIEVIWTEEPTHSFSAENIPLNILYEDENVFVINKAQGMVTHPANGNWTGTVANAVLGLEAARAQPAALAQSVPSELSASATVARGGIVHRLDKDTSGVLIVARNAEAQAFLSDQFRNRQAHKLYVAIVQGTPPQLSGRIDNQLGRDKRDRKKFSSVPSGGRRAVTDYKVVSRWAIDGVVRYSVLVLFPRTGRTHQLRVHMAELRCPIVGDPLYGKKDKLLPDATLLLHAHKLKIRVPGHNEDSVFTAPLPQRFFDALKIIRASCLPMENRS